MKTSRRKFLHTLFGLTAMLPMASIAKTKTRLVKQPLQISPLAGFQYYSGEQLWSHLTEGQPLMLKREADNRHDKYAIAVTWNGQKLGYLPRAQNYTLSQMMDRGEQLAAHIKTMKNSNDPWQKIQIGIAHNA